MQPALAFLQRHRVLGQGLLPTSALLEMAVAAGKVSINVMCRAAVHCKQAGFGEASACQKVQLQHVLHASAQLKWLRSSC